MSEYESGSFWSGALFAVCVGVVLVMIAGTAYNCGERAARSEIEAAAQ